MANSITKRVMKLSKMSVCYLVTLMETYESLSVSFLRKDTFFLGLDVTS